MLQFIFHINIMNCNIYFYFLGCDFGWVFWSCEKKKKTSKNDVGQKSAKRSKNFTSTV